MGPEPLVIHGVTVLTPINGRQKKHGFARKGFPLLNHHLGEIGRVRSL